jgi:glycerol-3-phosphate acyltransferase PlsY
MTEAAGWLTPHLLAAAIGGYLLGSIPFGLILSKLAGYGDIRRVGSGNIGATNVLRTGNQALALATLLLDGGKGMATTLGVLLALAWPAGLLTCAVWLAAAAAFRFSSLAALAALASAPLLMLWLADAPRALVAALLALLGFARHHANIARLLRGQEPRIARRQR